MIYTNRNDLPHPWVVALKQNDYQKHGDFSATELLGPAQAKELTSRHDSEISVDVIKNIHMMSGSGLDYMLGKAEVPGDHFNHQRFLFDYVCKGKEYVISFEPDYVYQSALDEGWKNSNKYTLMDLKETQIYAVKYGPKMDWVKQLGIYWFGLTSGNNLRKLIVDSDGKTHMVPQPNIAIDRMILSHRLKDWSYTEAYEKKLCETSDYPKCEIVTMDIQIPQKNSIINLLNDRIGIHSLAQNLSDDKLPECSPDERWLRNEKWVVQFIEGKQARRAVPKGGNFQTFEEALLFQQQREEKKKKKIDTEITFRPGVSIRCERFCTAAAFCHQRAKIKGEEMPKQTENTVTSKRESPF